MELLLLQKHQIVSRALRVATLMKGLKYVGLPDDVRIALLFTYC